MKNLLLASALVIAVSAPAFAQEVGDMPGNPNAVERPSQRGLGSDDLARDSNIRDNTGVIDGTTTESILPQNSVDGTISSPPIGEPLSNTGGNNQGSGINPGSSGSSLNQGATSGGNSAY